MKIFKFRLSRPCYDKPWRCPGWAGGGLKYAKIDRCDNGQIEFWYHAHNLKLSHFKFGHCNTCHVITFPFVIRHIDPSNILDNLKKFIRRRI